MISFFEGKAEEMNAKLLFMIFLVASTTSFFVLGDEANTGQSKFMLCYKLNILNSIFRYICIRLFLVIPLNIWIPFFLLWTNFLKHKIYLRNCKCYCAPNWEFFMQLKFFYPLGNFIYHIIAFSNKNYILFCSKYI